MKVWTIRDTKTGKTYSDCARKEPLKACRDILNGERPTGGPVLRYVLSRVDVKDLNPAN